MSILDEFLEDIQILGSGQEVYELAKKIRQIIDFEDALQVATAIFNEAEAMYTLDQDLAKKYRSLLKIVSL